MNLGAYRNSFIRELSTGTRRIVDLACLVGHRPTVVLLDEPSSGIAQREVEALAPVLLRLRDEMGASLLVIEHDLPLISSIADRLIALDQGELIAAGAPADVLTHPDVVESYLGNNPAARSSAPASGSSHMQPASSSGARAQLGRFVGGVRLQHVARARRGRRRVGARRSPRRRRRRSSADTTASAASSTTIAVADTLLRRRHDSTTAELRGARPRAPSAPGAG